MLWPMHSGPTSHSFMSQRLRLHYVDWGNADAPPLLLVFPPHDMAPEDIHTLWNSIACPTLLLYGQNSWASNPERDGRASYFKTARVVEFKDAGYWLHHDQFARFVRELNSFLT